MVTPYESRLVRYFRKLFNTNVVFKTYCRVIVLVEDSLKFMVNKRATLYVCQLNKPQAIGLVAPYI